LGETFEFEDTGDRRTEILDCDEVLDRDEALERDEVLDRKDDLSSFEDIMDRAADLSSSWNDISSSSLMEEKFEETIDWNDLSRLLLEELRELLLELVDGDPPENMSG
jgi:hypothetical protein